MRIRQVGIDRETVSDMSTRQHVYPSTCLSFYLVWICLSVYLSAYPPVDQPFSRFVYLSTCLPVDSPISRSVYSSTSQLAYPSICLFVHLSTCLPVELSIYLLISLSTFRSVYDLSIRLLLGLSTCPTTFLSTCLFVNFYTYKSPCRYLSSQL